MTKTKLVLIVFQVDNIND